MYLLLEGYEVSSIHNRYFHLHTYIHDTVGNTHYTLYNVHYRFYIIHYT